jgi:opacity protein-like surface antigen
MQHLQKTPGGATPFKQKSSSLSSLAWNGENPVALPFLFSITYKLQISQLLSFGIHANWWGVYPPSRSMPLWQSPFLLCLISAKGHGQMAIVLFTVPTWLIEPWGQPSEGSIMKRYFASALLLLGSASFAQAQGNAPAELVDTGNAAPDFSATSAAKATLIDPLAVADTFSRPATNPEYSFTAPVVTTALAAAPDPADPPAPSPKPKFIYGGRDDYRWQLSLGAVFYRFQSSIINASAVGVKTSVTYFLNDWFGVEGNVTAAFAPTILVNEHVKLLTYGGGPKVAWRQRQWEPWIHGIFGGAHEQPQTAAGSRNSYSIMAGGGADYRLNPRLSLRLEGDYVRTGFFHQSQNNFQVVAGIVFHF